MDILTKSKYKFGNCNIPLLKYRIHEKQIRIKGGDQSLDVVKKITSFYLLSLNSNITQDEIKLNYKINKLNKIELCDELMKYLVFRNKINKILNNKRISLIRHNIKIKNICINKVYSQIFQLKVVK